MLRDPTALSEAFAGTVLEGRRVRQLGRCRLVPDVADLDLRTAWQAARDAMPRTGRWPLAMSSWGGGLNDLFLAEPEPAEVDEFVRELEGLDPSPERPGWDDDYEAVEADSIACWMEGFPPELIERAVSELVPTTMTAWDWWLFTELQRDPALQGLVSVDYMVGTKYWFDPDDWCWYCCRPTAANSPHFTPTSPTEEVHNSERCCVTGASAGAPSS